MEVLISDSLSKSSRISYENHRQSFQKFMGEVFIAKALPASPYHISLYVTYLHLNNLKCSSIRTYLSAIAHFHKLDGYTDPTDSFRTKKLLLAIKRKSSVSEGRRSITKTILDKALVALRNVTSSSYNQKLYSCLFLIMYYACLRISEVAIAKHSQHTLMVGDVKLANSKLSIHLKSYKHSNQFSTKIHMKPVPHKYCPVKAFCKHIKVCGQQTGPFFATRHCKGISRDKVAKTLRLRLEICGLYSKSYNTHSFRIGRITNLAQAGTPYSKIQTMGRFKSTAYLKYIKPTIISLQWIFNIILACLTTFPFPISHAPSCWRTSCWPFQRQQ